MVQGGQLRNTEAPSNPTSFTALLALCPDQAAAVAAGSDAFNDGSEDALLLSPPRRLRRGMANSECFSPVLLTRRGEHNLIMGNALDVQVPGVLSACFVL